MLVNTIGTDSSSVSFAEYVNKNPLLGSAVDTSIYDIKQFLSRPVICQNVSWTTVMTRGTSLMSMLPSAMLASGVWAEKLKGFLGFKGTFCFKVQFNCQKFQSGIALISILPAAGHISANRRALVKSDIIYKSQLPSVRHNINESDEVEIRVPFISPELFYNRTAPIDWAEVYVDVYAQLKGGDIVGTCWCWFEDVELFIPTAQSGGFTKGKRQIAYSDREDEGGIISQPLSLFARGFDALGSNIPSLSSVSKPTAWFLDACSKGASAFGFSQTVDTETRKAVIPKSLPHFNNCDTNDTSDSFGLTAANKISHMAGFAGTDIDEMSLSYITQIPSYATTWNWINTQVTSTSVGSIEVHPCVPSNYTTVTPTASPAIGIYRLSPMGYVATSFTNWRGSIVYRFFASKTDFHTGRLLFTFAPNTNAAIIDVMSNAPYVYKWIWDIKESHSFEIEVPYLNSASWSSTGTLQGRENSIGALHCFVLNPLNAPTTVSNNIDIVMEVRAGKDFELNVALPADRFTPIIAYSGDINTNRKHKHRERMYVDRDETDKIRLSDKRKKKSLISSKRSFKMNQIYCEGPLDVEQTGSALHLSGNYSNIEVAKQSLDKDISSLLTVGESVKSLRQLLKRTCYLYSSIIPSATVKFNFSFNPFTPYLGVAINAGANNLMPPSFYVDHFTKFSSMYALQRGGVIIRYLSDSSFGFVIARLENIGRTLVPLSINSNLVNVVNGSDQESGVISLTQSQGAIDVLVPYLARTASIPVVQLSNPVAGATDARPYMDNKYIEVITHSHDDNPRFDFACRKTADDYSLGGFIGVLPLYQHPVAFPN